MLFDDQELTLLASFTKRMSVGELKTEAARRYNHTAPADWWNPRPAFADEPTYNWSGKALDAAAKPAMSHLEHIDPDAWARVRQYVMRLASEEPLRK